MNDNPLSLAVDNAYVRAHMHMTDNVRDTHPLNADDIAEVRTLLQQHNAVLISHYYTNNAVQALTEATGGMVADSLAMTQFGATHSADTLIVSGVRFMAETAKVLNPNKRVVTTDAQATCSLDLLCPADELQQWREKHPERETVVYINTSAEVKALADWVVTSSIAEELIDHLHAEGKQILWAPDKHLGRYLQTQTGADMLLWDGACVVHEEFKANGLSSLKHLYPEAAVLAHPESPEAILAMSDVVGSTSKLIRAAQTLPNKRIIVATDEGIFYKMRQLAPDKELLIAPTAGKGATCKSCAHCPWMARNSVAKIKHLLQNEAQLAQAQVDLPPVTASAAQIPLTRMMQFADSVHACQHNKQLA